MPTDALTMKIASLVAAAVLAWANTGTLALAQSPEIPPAEALCARTPDPSRWLSAVDADTGASPAIISAHRGGTRLAPENTLLAYEYAYAYEVAMIEVDVRQTADRRFVAFHDSDVAAKSDGEGTIETMSFEQVRELNVAAFEPWIGSEYDPAQMASLEEVLELARSVGGGIEFDMKFMLDSQPTADLAGFAQIVNAYPEVLARSIINLPPPVAQAARALIPEGRFIYNLLLGEEDPAALYSISFIASAFGSDLAKFTVERIHAIHDGCGLVIPHSYDEGAEREGDQILLARERGADGVQTNQPDLARALLVGPVDTSLTWDDSRMALCLANARNGLGLPKKALTVGNATLTTGPQGCVRIEGGRPATANFVGDASASAATLVAESRNAERFGGAMGLVALLGLVLLARARHQVA